MALNTPALEEAIFSAFSDDKPMQPDQEANLRRLSNKLATAVAAHLMTLTVTTNPAATGLVSAPSGGPVTGVLTTVLS